MHSSASQPPPHLKQVSHGDTVTLQQTEGMDTVLEDSDSSLGLWKASIYHLNPCFILVPASASSLELCPGLQMQIFVHSRHLRLSRQFPALCGTCHSDNLMNKDHTSSKRPAFSSPAPPPLSEDNAQPVGGYLNDSRNENLLRHLSKLRHYTMPQGTEKTSHMVVAFLSGKDAALHM